MEEEIKGAANQSEEMNNEEAVENDQQGGDDGNGTPEVTIESLMEEIAKLKTSEQKTKMALDKALKEKGALTKQYRTVLTESQQAKIDKETADEEHRKYVEELENFKRKTNAKERYLLQGMSVEMAIKAAEAEVSGDMETLTDIQKKHTETVLKKAKEEWAGQMGQPQFGTGENSMTKEQIMGIKNDQQRIRAIAQNLNLFYGGKK